MEPTVEKLPKMFSLAEKLDRDNRYASLLDTMRHALLAGKSVWHGFAEDLFRSIDLKILQKFVRDFVLAFSIEGDEEATDMESPEDVDALCSKTASAAKKWESVADRLWAQNPKSRSGASREPVHVPV